MRAIPTSALVLALTLCAVVRADDAAPSAKELLDSAEAKRKAGDLSGAYEDLKRAGDLVAKDDARMAHDGAAESAKAGDVKSTVALLKLAAKIAPADFPMDLVLWRRAVETSRKKGGSQEPDLQLIQAEVSSIRGKPFKEDVPAAKQSPDEFGEIVDGMIEKEMPKATREDVQAGLRRLGLLPERFDMKKDVSDAMKSQAAAYYLPSKKKFFNLMNDASPVIVETIAAHELVHALQDQYFDLDPWVESHGARADGVRDDDKTLALRCVVEGEATFVQMVWQLEHMMRMSPEQALDAARMSLPMVGNMEIEQLVAMAKASNMAPPGSDVAKSIDEMDKIQPYVLVPLFAAYMNGAQLVSLVDSKKEGWAAVDQLYENPPASSEQCLHPDKYAKKRDLPTPVTLPDFPEIAAGGWRAADAAVHGEIYFRVLLKRNGVDGKTAKKAAAGWDGDMYRAWRTADGKTAIVLATTWDTPEDAAEFFDAYRAALAKKYEKLRDEGSVERKKGDEPNPFLYGCGDDALGEGALLLRGQEVFAVEGFAADLRAKIVERLAALKIEHVE